MIHPRLLQRLITEVHERGVGRSQQIAASLGLVTHEEYQRLLALHQVSRQRIDQLTRQIDELETRLKMQNRPSDVT